MRGVSLAQVERGTRHEMEHTRDRNVARKIAIDHLAEDPRYYEKLSRASVRNPAIRRAAANPPAYFVIDPRTNRILSIRRAGVRRGPMGMHGAFVDAEGDARKAAASLGRSVYVVVHPYIPKGFRKGTTVSPLFYSYGAVEVSPEGVRRNSSRRRGKTRRNPRMTRGAQEFISDEISKLVRRGYEQKRAIAAAYDIARRKGYSVPPPPRRNPSRVFRNRGCKLVSLRSEHAADKLARCLQKAGIRTSVSRHGRGWAVTASGDARQAKVALGKLLQSNPGLFNALGASIIGGIGFGVGAGVVQRYIIGDGPRKAKCNPKKCRNPKHRHRNPLLQAVSLAAGNPRLKCPFRDGQKIPVEKARAWIKSTKNPELLRQFEAAYRIKCEADGKPKYVRWKTIPIGDPKQLEMVTAMAEYGTTDETVYKPPKGSKKGRAWYRHQWGEGQKGSKPVPVLAAPSGKALIMPLGKGQVVNDWMRG